MTSKKKRMTENDPKIIIHSVNKNTDIYFYKKKICRRKMTERKRLIFISVLSFIQGLRRGSSETEGRIRTIGRLRLNEAVSIPNISLRNERNQEKWG